MQTRREYAAYRGDELLHIGTKGVLANKLGVSVSTISFYSRPCHRKRAEAGNINRRIIVVPLDDPNDIDETED